MSFNRRIERRSVPLHAENRPRGREGRFSFFGSHDAESAQQILEHVAAALSGALCVCDLARGRLAPIGRGMTDMLGYPAEHIGALDAQGIRSLIHPDDLVRVNIAARRIAGLTNGESSEEIFRVRHADGGWRLLRGRAAVLARDRAGDASAIVCTLIDISAHQPLAGASARESEHAAILRMMLEHVPEGITIVGGPPDFPIIARSSRAQEMLGAPPAQFLEVPRGERYGAGALYTTDGRSVPRPEETPLYRATRHGETTSAEEWVIQRPHGEPITVEINAVPIRARDGKIAGAVSCWRDVTDRKRMEQRLHETLEQLNLATRAARLCLWDYGVATGTLQLSEESRELFGWGPDDSGVTLDTFVAMVHPDDRERVTRAIERALKEYAEYDVQYRIVRPDGEERWVAAVGDCFYDPLGRPMRFLGAMIDITARKRAEAALRESEERFRQLAETIDDVFWVFDVNAGKWLYLSPAYARLYGRPPDERYADSTAWLRAVHPEDRERVERAYARQGEGRTFDHEYRIETPRGVRWVRDRCLPVQDASGRIARIVGVTQDITERRLAAQAARKSDRPPHEFLATLAHELRSPLEAIVHTVEMLRIASASSLDLAPAQRALLRQVGILERVAEDLLDVVRASGETLQRQPLDAAAIVQHAVELAKPLAQARRQTLEVAVARAPMPLVGDAKRLTKAVANVVANATKYTDDGGRIAVRASPCDGAAVIEIEDNGIGIAGELLDRIFEPLVRGGATVEGRKVAGLGIGLALTRQLVTLHGGTITAYSEGPGKGSRFTLRLPLAHRNRPSADAGWLDRAAESDVRDHAK